MKLLIAGRRGELFVDTIHRRDHTREIRDLRVREKKCAVFEDLGGGGIQDDEHGLERRGLEAMWTLKLKES